MRPIARNGNVIDPHVVGLLNTDGITGVGQNLGDFEVADDNLGKSIRCPCLYCVGNALTLLTSITRRPTPTRAERVKGGEWQDVEYRLNVRTGSTGAEDGLVGTDLDDFVTSDGSRDNNDGWSASSQGGLEGSEGGNCSNSSGSSASSSKTRLDVSLKSQRVRLTLR